MRLEGNLDNHAILFLGDDDLNSVAVGLMGGADKMVVLDIDPNVLSVVKEASKECSFEIEREQRTRSVTQAMHTIGGQS